MRLLKAAKDQVLGWRLQKEAFITVNVLYFVRCKPYRLFLFPWVYFRSYDYKALLFPHSSSSLSLHVFILLYNQFVSMKVWRV